MHRLVPYLVCLAFTAAALLLHLSDYSNSMLNDNGHTLAESEMASVVALHQTHPVFMKRPLTTLLLHAATQLTGWSLAQSFAVVNFLLLFACGVLLFHLSFFITSSRRGALLNLVFFYLCFSNLFAFFPPVYTYDEPVQYALVFLSLGFALRGEWLWWVVAFTLALVARESSLLLLPGLWLLAAQSPVRSGHRVLWLSLPVVCYAVFLVFFIRSHGIAAATASDFTGRLYHLAYNFQDRGYAVETLVSLFLAVGLPVTWLLWRREKRPYQKYVTAFWVTLALNTVVVIFAAKARETRLFALPLLFLWPVFSSVFAAELRGLASFTTFRMLLGSGVRLLIFLTGLSVASYLAFEVYASTTIGVDRYFNGYLFLLLAVLTVYGATAGATKGDRQTG